MRRLISSSKPVNARPCTLIFMTRTCGGGGGYATPQRVSKLRVVELSGKNQQIVHAECSQLVVRFFRPRSIFDLVMRGQRSNFRKIDNFSFLH